MSPAITNKPHGPVVGRRAFELGGPGGFEAPTSPPAWLLEALGELLKVDSQVPCQGFGPTGLRGVRWC